MDPDPTHARRGPRALPLDRRAPRDEPSIFEFATMSGRFEAAPGLTPSRLQVMVRSRPAEPGYFRSRFRIVVEEGKAVEFDVEAEVTLNEEDDFYHITERQEGDFFWDDSLL
jgi:hypothetical protein